MIGHVAAAIYPVDGDSFFFQLRFAPQQIFLFAAPTERVDVRMLKKQKSRRALPLRDLFRVLILQLPRGFVFDQAKVFNNKIHFETGRRAGLPLQKYSPIQIRFQQTVRIASFFEFLELLNRFIPKEFSS